MPKNWTFILVGMLSSFVISQTPPVVPSNSSAFTTDAKKNRTAVINIQTVQSPPMPLLPLTDVAFSSLNGNGLSGLIADINPTNAINSVTNYMAYVSCNPDDWPGDITLSDALQSLTTDEVIAIVFFSLHTDYCNLTRPLPNSFQMAYSTTNIMNATNIFNALTPNNDNDAPPAAIFPYGYGTSGSDGSSGVFGGGAPSTAVAMIILYSITGVITVLFLIIILTGAVRAHRHPERYGPRGLVGRSRQSRAKGIARAMLDTIPIVKFGQEETEPKPGDIELAESSSRQGPRPPSNEIGAKEISTSTVPVSPTLDTASNDGIDQHPSSSGPVESRLDAKRDGLPEALGCSICTEDFENGQDIRVLPCDHKFHPACVDPWLLDVSGTCPLCRVDLRPPENRDSAEGPRDDEDAVRGAMPPPLDPNGERAGGRRQAIRNFLDRRLLNDASREERIATLRSFRMQQRARAQADPAEAEATTQEERENESRWQRVRRSLTFASHPTRSL